jgi:hypothetical protein
MPDEEESRLHSALKECHRSCRDASSALTHPGRIMIYNSGDHRNLIAAYAAARVKYDAARSAWRAYRTPVEES